MAALFWSAAERLGLQAVSFLISIVLARLLLPEQYGLIGMLVFFMAVSQSILDSGFGAALIQKKEATPVDESSIFLFNIFVGVLLAGLLSLAAPLIADFFNQPILIPLTRVMSLNIVINSFALIQSTLVIKSLNFKTQIKVSLTATVLSGIVGISMAYSGYGVWSLVVQSLANSFMRAVLFWIFSSWRPALVFRFDSLKQMFPFGSRMLLSGLLDTFFQNLYQVFIGRMFSPADLGYFVRARSMETMVVQATSGTLSRVMFPAMSAIQDDIARLKQAYRKTISFSVFVNFPLMLGLMVAARPIILLLLTEKWAMSIPYFQVMCLIGMLYPLDLLNLNILKVKGRSDLFFKVEIIKKMLIAAAIFITYRYGIMAMLYGNLATALIGYGLNSYYSNRLIGYPAKEQIRDVLPYLILSILMSLLMVFTAGLVDFNLWAQLASQAAVGAVFYLGANYLLKTSTSLEMIDIVKNFFSGLRKARSLG
jgi:teichuronic acid exporter